jgi:hypothetical protein
MKMLSKNLVSLIVLAGAVGMAACSSPPDDGTGGVGGATGGTSGTGGRGGSTGGRGGSSTGGTTGGTGAATGGTGTGGAGTGGATGTGGAGTGGAGTGGADGTGGAGTGGATGGTGGATGTGGAGGAGGSEGTGGTGGGAPTDGPPPSSTCNYTPKANATMASLKFVPVTLMGLPTGDMTQGSGYRDGITEIRFIPGAPNDFLLLQKGGRINHYRLAGDGAKMATLVRTIPFTGVASPEDIGLVAMTFDPGFEQNKLLYLGYGTGLTATKVSRVTYSGEAFTDRVDIMSFSSGGGGRGWHSMGSMGFDPMGNMWILHGEFNTGAPAQNMGSPLGKLHRIVPSRTAGMGGFMPAAGNAMGSIYARGLRSPWRGNLDAKGRYIIGDVQNTNNEEVNVVTASGQNFGHPSCTGGGCKAAMVTWDGPGDPYNGQGDEAKEGRVGRAVWIGPQYGDCGNDRYGGALTGVQLIGDFFSGWVRGVVINDAGTRGPDRLLGTLGTVTTWDQNKDGYLYVAKFGLYHQGATSERQGFHRVCLETDTSPACN